MLHQSNHCSANPYVRLNTKVNSVETKDFEFPWTSSSLNAYFFCMTELQAFSKRWLHVPRPFLNSGERILAVLLTLLVYLPTIIFLALFIFLWGGGYFHFGQPFLLAVLFQVSCVCYARLEHRILPDRERLARCATLLLVFLTDRLRLRL